MGNKHTQDIQYLSDESSVSLGGDRNAATGITGDYSLKWRPGAAGITERAVMGTGTGEGWLMYFLGKYLVLEIWHMGGLIHTLSLDCSELVHARNSTQHIAALGYDLDDEWVSLGCVSLDSRGSTTQGTHKDWKLPGLSGYFSQPEVMNLGVIPVKTSQGSVHRYLNGKFTLLEGELYSEEYLSRGTLVNLTGQALDQIGNRSR